MGGPLPAALSPQLLWGVPLQRSNLSRVGLLRTRVIARAVDDYHRAMPLTRQHVLDRRRDARRLIGHALAQARVARGLSQQDAAAHVGIAQSAIAKTELGLRAVPFTEALDLSRLYGIDPMSLDPRTLAAGEGAESSS